VAAIARATSRTGTTVASDVSSDSHADEVVTSFVVPSDKSARAVSANPAPAGAPAVIVMALTVALGAGAVGEDALVPHEILSRMAAAVIVLLTMPRS